VETSLPARSEAAKLLQLLLNPNVCRLLSCLPAKPGECFSLEAIAEAYGDRGQAALMLAKCESAKIVRRGPDGYTLNREWVNELSATLVADSPLEHAVTKHRALRPFVVAGRLASYPAKAPVLAELYAAIAETLGAGSVWQEAALNAELAQIVDDPAGIRRALVDHGLLVREAGSSVYSVPE
jgi:hypothetical protein